MSALHVARLEWTHLSHSAVAYILALLFVLALGLPVFHLDSGANIFLNSQASMRVFFSLLPWFYVVLIPALCMRVWASEHRNGTLELLRALPLSSFDLVCGKFLAHMAMLSFSLLASLPFPFLIASMGDLDWGPVVGGYLGAFLLATAAVALCQTVSLFSKNQAAAFMFGFLTLGLATFAPFDPLQFNERFISFARGILDSRNLIFFLLITLACLGINIKCLQWRSAR